MIEKKIVFRIEAIVLIFVLFVILATCDIKRIEYGILLVTGLMCAYGLWKQCISKTMLKIILGYMIYIIVQIYGLTNNFSSHAIRCVIASILILMFLVFCTEYMRITMLSLVCKLYYLFQAVLWVKIFWRGSSSLSLNNVWAGYYLFLFAIYAVVYVMRTRTKEILTLKQWCVLGINGLSCVILIFFTSARTALLTGGIIFLCFIAFMVYTPSASMLKCVYWGLIIAITIGTFFYANIRTFDWYGTLNYYSQILFSKNIDSSRGYLWSMGLNQLGEHWLFGIGTGVLPSLARYANSSFHNAYIQLLVQNGLIGLSSIIVVFYMIWNTLCKFKDDLVVKLVLACVVGIMFYNCFEVTLLANKVALGLMQWFIIGIGMNWTKMLSNKSKI